VKVEKYIYETKHKRSRKKMKHGYILLCCSYPSSSARLREFVHHFPLLSLNCLDVKMMVGEDYGNAIVNIDGEV